MMTSATFSTSPEAQQAAVLLEGYRFELGQHDARQWVSLWLESYRPSWIRDAVIEALYQGRYKSISVKQILELWQRRGQPIRHVTHDFEAAVCREFGEVKLVPAKAAPALPMSTVASTAAANVSHSTETRASFGRTATYNRSNQWRSHQQQYMPPTPAHSPAANAPRKIATLKPRPTAAVSFNLAELAASSPGMATAQVPNQMSDQTVERTSAATAQTATASSTVEADGTHKGHTEENSDRKEVLDNKAWRDFPSYTTPAYATANREEALLAQRQFNGVLYSSARAIQPFKPALPFSAQTLRLAKQKAIAMMAQTR